MVDKSADFEKKTVFKLAEKQWK